MVLKQRVERLEAKITTHSSAEGEDDILTPRDVAFLLCERQRLEEEGGAESRALCGIMDKLFEKHGRACKAHPPKALTPEQAHEALIAASERTEEEEEEFDRKWRERLQEERERIRGGIADIDSLEE